MSTLNVQGLRREARSYARALTIAGSDSGGGAGIQADLKTFSALGCYGMSVITALTAQNTVAVRGIHPVPPAFIEEQMDAVLGDIGVDAVKIGMLHSAAVIRAVAGKLRQHGIGQVVLDPVMVAKSGDRLLQDEAVEELRATLVPLARVITPNLPEAGTLLGRAVETVDQMEEAARELLDLGPEAVIVKGGHLAGGKSADCLAVGGAADVEIRWLEAERVDTLNTHGTGCTFSSAICSFLARGASLTDAAEEAKRYLSEAIRRGAPFRLGEGHGPVHHFYHVWSD